MNSLTTGDDALVRALVGGVELDRDDGVGDGEGEGEARDREGQLDVALGPGDPGVARQVAVGERDLGPRGDELMKCLVGPFRGPTMVGDSFAAQIDEFYKAARASADARNAAREA